MLATCQKSIFNQEKWYWYTNVTTTLQQLTWKVGLILFFHFFFPSKLVGGGNEISFPPKAERTHPLSLWSLSYSPQIALRRPSPVLHRSSAPSPSVSSARSGPPPKSASGILHRSSAPSPSLSPARSGAGRPCPSGNSVSLSEIIEWCLYFAQYALICLPKEKLRTDVFNLLICFGGFFFLNTVGRRYTGFIYKNRRE
jgi:hypothetical protein